MKNLLTTITVGLVVTFIFLFMDNVCRDASETICQAGSGLDGPEFPEFWALYDRAEEFYDDLARVKQDGKWFHIRPDGTRLYPESYDWVGSIFFEGLMMVREAGREFHIRRDGTRPYQQTYDQASNFSEGFAKVESGERQFHIRPDGTRPYQQTYDWAGAFYNGLASVRQDGKWFHIRPDGTRPYQENYRSVGLFSKIDNITWVMKENGEAIQIRKDGSRVH